MKKIIKTITLILFTWPLVAGTGSNEYLSIDFSKINEFNSMLREFDLNEKANNGHSITATEYTKLLDKWDKLNKQEQIEIMHGNNNCSWKNTLALNLLYSFSTKAEWKSFIEKISCYNSSGVSLTLSSVNSMVALNTAYHTLLDLLQRDLNMFEKGRFKICSTIKIAAKNRNDQKAFDRLQKWEDLINQCFAYSNLDKIRKVNDFFNNMIIAKPDNNIEHNRDYWQSPIETLVRGKGDCEDFALVKYVSLRMLGIPKKQLFIGIIRLPQFGELHAVLLYYPKAADDPYVLDNLPFEYGGFKTSHIIKMSTRISQFNVKPLIAFNENLYIEFKRGLERKYLNKNQINDIPMFTNAINNSKSLLSKLSG